MKTKTFLLGTKDRMTQVFDENGHAVPVTVVNVQPNTVTAVRTEEADGYNAVQVAFGAKNKRSLTQAILGHLKKSGLENAKAMQEFRVENPSDYNVGDSIDVTKLEEGQKVTISATSKGKGFQGGVKRHNFSGGRRSHGNKHAEREGGSIGAGGPQRVFKNQKMPGRMGTDRITTKNLKVIAVDQENNRVMIKGAIAGVPGGLVEIRA